MTETGFNRDTSRDSSNPSILPEKQPTPLKIFDFPFEDDTPHALGKARGLARVREKWKNAVRVKKGGGCGLQILKKTFQTPTHAIIVPKWYVRGVKPSDYISSSSLPLISPPILIQPPLHLSLSLP